MKKILVVIVLLTIVSMNVYKRIEKQETSSLACELVIANLEVLAQSESGTVGDGVKCYNTYNSCWFWDCEHIWRCSGLECYDVKCDKKSDPDKCAKMN